MSRQPVNRGAMERLQRSQGGAGARIDFLPAEGGEGVALAAFLVFDMESWCSEDKQQPDL